MKIPYYIFDVDGTLADIEHRRGFVTSKPKNWPAFNAAMKFDTDIEPVCDMLRALASYQLCDIIVLSGREGTKENLKMTRNFLKTFALPHTTLHLRKKKDYRRDDIVKEEFLDMLIKEYGYEPTAVFDDRKQVVDMWQRRGIFTFDVGQGKGDF